jgi:hypothetical protein
LSGELFAPTIIREGLAQLRGTNMTVWKWFFKKTSPATQSKQPRSLHRSYLNLDRLEARDQPGSILDVFELIPSILTGLSLDQFILQWQADHPPPGVTVPSSPPPSPPANPPSPPPTPEEAGAGTSVQTPTLSSTLPDDSLLSGPIAWGNDDTTPSLPAIANQPTTNKGPDIPNGAVPAAAQTPTGASGGMSTPGGGSSSNDPGANFTVTSNVLSGNYTREYTQSGLVGTQSVSLNVRIESSFSSTMGVLEEHGKITYSAYAKMDGVTSFSVSNVQVDFTQPISQNEHGLQLLGLPTDQSALTGYDWANFGWSSADFDVVYWSDSVRSNMVGLQEVAPGTTYSFQSHTESDYTITTLQSWLPADEPHYATRGLDSIYSGSYLTDWTRTDSPSYFPSTAPTFGADGRPTDLFSAAPAGSKYLERSFDKGSYSGSQSLTDIMSDPVTVLTGSAKSNSTTAGIDGYRRYSSDELTVNNTESGPVAAQDHFTWLNDYQQTSKYDNSHTADFTTALIDLPVGTVTTTANRTTEVATDRSELRNEYVRDDGTTRVSGTMFSGRSNTKPSKFVSKESSTTTYAPTLMIDEYGQAHNNPEPRTSDQLTYFYSQDQKYFSVNNNLSNRTVTFRDNEGDELGESINTVFEATTGTNGTTAQQSGTVDRLAGTTMAADYSGTTNSDDFRVSFSTAALTTTDESASRNQIAFALGRGQSSSTWATKGDFNADGQQSSGTDYSSTIGTDDILFSLSWDQLIAKNEPTRTTTTLGSSSSKFNTLTDLTFTSATAYDGQVYSSAKDVQNQTLIATENGTVTLYDAEDATLEQGQMTIDGWQRNQQTTKIDRIADVRYVSGVATQGNIDHRSDFKNEVQYYGKRTLTDFYTGTTEKTATQGQGTQQLIDYITYATINGVWVPTAGHTAKLNGTEKVELQTDGNAKDGFGHSATWTSKTTVHGSANELVQQLWMAGETGWVLTENTVDIQRSGGSKSSFVQVDNGMGQLPPAPGILETFNNKLEKDSWSNYSVTTKGTPTNYSFNQTNEGRTSSTTTKYHAWTNNTIGEGSQRHSKAVTTNSYFNQHIGTQVDGQVTLSKLYQRTFFRADSDTNGYFWSPQVKSWSELHSHDSTVTSREGTSAAGSGHVTSVMRKWGQWTTTDLASGQTYGQNSMDAPAMVSTGDLSWPTQVPTYDDPANPNYLNIVVNALEDGKVMVANWITFGQLDGVREEGARLATEYYGRDYVMDGLHWGLHTGGNILQIVGGVIDVGVGVSITFASGGFGIIAGVGLIGIGIDQVIAGAYNLSSTTHGPSVLEYTSERAAVGLGASQGTAQVIGGLTPAVLSIGVTAVDGICKIISRSSTPNKALLRSNLSPATEQRLEGGLRAAQDNFDPILRKLFKDTIDADFQGIWLKRTLNTQFHDGHLAIYFQREAHLTGRVVGEEVQHAIEFTLGATREAIIANARRLNIPDSEIVHWWHRRVFTRLLQNINAGNYGMGVLSNHTGDVYRAYQAVGGQLTMDQILAKQFNGLY